MYDELYELGMQEALEDYESLDEGIGASIAKSVGVTAAGSALTYGTGKLIGKKVSNPAAKILISDKQDQIFARNKWQEYMKKTGKKISYKEFIKKNKLIYAGGVAGSAAAGAGIGLAVGKVIEKIF